MALTEFYRFLPRFWRDREINPRAFDGIGFICQFIAPNMLWFEDYQALIETGALPADSRLL